MYHQTVEGYSLGHLKPTKIIETPIINLFSLLITNRMAITQNIFHSVYKMKDMDDNILTLHAHREGLYKITIQLRSEKREREIAQIDVEHRCMSMTRDKSKHFMRALCGYGFNWTLINKDMPMRVDKVLLIEHDGNDTDYY